MASYLLGWSIPPVAISALCLAISSFSTWTNPFSGTRSRSKFLPPIPNYSPPSSMVSRNYPLKLPVAYSTMLSWKSGRTPWGYKYLLKISSRTATDYLQYGQDKEVQNLDRRDLAARRRGLEPEHADWMNMLALATKHFGNFLPKRYGQ